LLEFIFLFWVQNFGGTSPKIFKGQNMQNLAWFRSTSKFGGECLWKGWRYSKSVSYSTDSDSSCVRRNKSGEVWSSNLGDLDVELYPLKTHFSEDHISAPRECCAPKFLHTLENYQALLAHLHRKRGHFTIFFQGGSKVGLNCSKLATITLKPKRIA